MELSFRNWNFQRRDADFLNSSASGEETGGVFWVVQKRKLFNGTHGGQDGKNGVYSFTKESAKKKRPSIVVPSGKNLTKFIGFHQVERW